MAASQYGNPLIEEPPDDGRGGVGAGIVEQDVVEARISLRLNAGDGFGEKAVAVMNGGHDGQRGGSSKEGSSGQMVRHQHPSGAPARVQAARSRPPAGADWPASPKRRGRPEFYAVWQWSRPGARLGGIGRRRRIGGATRPDRHDGAPHAPAENDANEPVSYLFRLNAPFGVGIAGLNPVGWGNWSVKS